MTDYSETFLDHYRRPRNLGDLEEPDVVVIVREESCGDMLRLAIGLQPAGDDVGPSQRRIAAVRVKAFGCAAAVAVGSVVSELLIGVSAGEAARLGTDDIVAALDGLPPRRLHAAALGREAIRRALDGLAPAAPISRREARGARE